jgi:hypothetical protein
VGKAPPKDPPSLSAAGERAEAGSRAGFFASLEKTKEGRMAHELSQFAAEVERFEAEVWPDLSEHSFWERFGSLAICWFLFLILLELRKDKEPA